MAYWVIVITIIVFALFFIPFIIYSDIRLDDGFGCSFRTYSFSQKTYLTIEIVLFVGIAPLLMIVFGLLTISNTHQMRVVRIARHRRTERQQARMLLLQEMARNRIGNGNNQIHAVAVPLSIIRQRHH